MLIVLGASVAVAVLADAVFTVIHATEHKGPIARTMLRIGRAGVHRLPRRLRTAAGIVITFMIVLSWTLGLWLAWTIALLDPSIAIQTARGVPAPDLLDAIYVAGFAIFTLGTGDLEAGTQVGRLVTVAASATGLFTVTLEVTYLVSLTSAISHERSTARQAYALGHDVSTILRRAWDGESFRPIEPYLQEVARDLSTLAERHRLFPVLHDVLPNERRMALGPSLLALSDACEVMAHAVGQPAALRTLSYEQVTEAMDAVLRGLPRRERELSPPAAPDTAAALAVVGEVPARTVEETDVVAARRRGLFALAMEEGWRDAAYEVVRVS